MQTEQATKSVIQPYDAYLIMDHNKPKLVCGKPLNRKCIRITSVERIGNSIKVLPAKSSSPAISYIAAQRYFSGKEVTEVTKQSCKKALERLRILFYHERVR